MMEKRLTQRLRVEIGEELVWHTRRCRLYHGVLLPIIHFLGTFRQATAYTLQVLYPCGVTV